MQYRETMQRRPLILVTNDDGIDSAGLAAAARGAMKVGEVIIAAPSEQQTAMGRAYPRREDQRKKTGHHSQRDQHGSKLRQFDHQQRDHRGSS